MALTGKTIGQLTKYTSSLTGNELFPLEYDGITYHISQSQFSSNIYNTNGTLAGNRVVTLDDKQLVFKSNQSTLQNYTFTTGTPTGVTPSTWPASVIFEGEYLMSSANQEPHNTRAWGRNQGGSQRSLWVNQVYADITAESTGITNVYNQYFITRRGSVLDTSTAVTAQMLGVTSVVGHFHGGSAATTASIVTNDQTAFQATANNYLATVNNVYAFKASSAVYALATQNTLVNNYYSFYSQVFVGFPGSTPTSTLTNYYGVFLDTPSIRGNGTITNRWGVYAPDIAMNHYINGKLLLGLTTPSTFLLDVNGNARVSGNTILSGTYRILYFGSDTSNTYIVGENNDGLYLSAKKIEYSDSNIKYGRFQRIGGITSFLIGEDGAGRAAVASSILELFSTTQGFLPPRMTTAQRDAIASPATGLSVYNTTTNENNTYNGTAWVAAGGSNIYTADGTLTGNRVVSMDSNSLTFLKTIAVVTNAEGLDIKNDTVSTVSNNSYSPSLTFSAFGWGGTSASTLSRIRQYLVPVSGSPWNQPTLRWDGWNTGAWTNLMTLRSFNFGGGESYGGLTVSGININVTSGQIDNGSSSAQLVFLNGNGNGGIKLQGWNQYIEMKASTGISFHNGSSEMGRFYTATGNLLIQTGGTFADAGFKLDVNGTARVSNRLTIAGQTGNIYLSIGTGTGNAQFYWSSYVLSIGGVKVAVENLIADPSGTSGGANRANSSVDCRGYLVADSIGIGTTTNTINTSAITQIDSTTRGFLPPRMTTTQINAIASPAEGLMAYNTTISHMCVYQAGAWAKLSHSPM